MTSPSVPCAAAAMQHRRQCAAARPAQFRWRHLMSPIQRLSCVHQHRSPSRSSRRHGLRRALRSFRSSSSTASLGSSCPMMLAATRSLPQPTRRKQCPRPLPGPYGGNDAGTFTIAHNSTRGFAQSGFNEVATSPAIPKRPAARLRRCRRFPNWRVSDSRWRAREVRHAHSTSG